MLNKKQKIVVWIALVFVILTFLFPCWTREGERETQDRYLFGYIFDPPKVGVYYMSVESKILFAQLMVIVIVAFGLIITLADKRRKD